MEMKQRVQHLIADVERACIKYKLNMTIYDGRPIDDTSLSQNQSLRLAL